MRDARGVWPCFCRPSSELVALLFSMPWINALERRFGYLAVPGLMRIVVAFNLFVYLLMATQPGFAAVLELRPDKILTGQVWRLFTYVFVPQVNLGTPLDLFSTFVYLNFLWLIGEGIEQVWGSFRLTLYYLVGVLGTTVAAFVLKAAGVTGFYLNLTLFFAFATLLPDYLILLFFFVPVRVKWLSLFAMGVVFLQLGGGTITEKVAITVSLGNYLIFFVPVWFQHVREREGITARRQQYQQARSGDAASTAAEVVEPLHRCKVCGRTEASTPDLEFRVAGDGEEYCLEHLPSRRLEMQMPPPLPGGSPT